MLVKRKENVNHEKENVNHEKENVNHEKVKKNFLVIPCRRLRSPIWLRRTFASSSSFISSAAFSSSSFGVSRGRRFSSSLSIKPFGPGISS